MERPQRLHYAAPRRSILLTMQEITEVEETLRYWLAQEDWYPSRYTQNFLVNNSVEVANETLARIASDAQPEPHSYLALLYSLRQKYCW